MPQVETVRGPIPTEDLGVTLMHEHIFVLTADMQQNYPDEWGSEDERVADAVDRLQRAYDAGARTIVDPTVVGLGRYIPTVQRIARELADRQVPLSIVVATGIYTYEDVPFFFRHRGPALDEALGTEVPDPMVDLFVRDIREGVAGTDVRAGMLKCAIDRPGMTGGVERVMRAVAKAHHATGVPVTVHTHPESRTGLEVKRVLCDEEGVDPGRVVLGHSGDTTDVDHLCELADARVRPRHGPVRHQPRDHLRGPGGHAGGDGAPGVRRADGPLPGRELLRRLVDPDLRAFLPQWHYTHLFEDVFPYVLERGVTQDQIDTMLVDVPRRFFEESAA